MRNVTVACAVSLILAGCGGGGDTPTPSPTPTPAPTIQFTASKTEVLRGSSVDLTWSTTNATSCTTSGSWSGTRSTNGVESIKISNDSNSFSITCSGPSGNITASVNVIGVLFVTNVIVSDDPNYNFPNVTRQDMNRGFVDTGSANVFTLGQDNKMHVLMFPSYFDQMSSITNYGKTQLPGFELVETSPNKFSFVKFFPEARLGLARSWALLDSKNTSSKKVVIVDHGEELPGVSDAATLPLGDVWVASDSGSGFSMQKISNYKAFHHNVATGDITGDGKEDIVAVAMLTKTGGKQERLHSYTQLSNNTYQQDLSFAPETYPDTWFNNGSGAVTIVDIDGDGQPEIIQANQTDWPKPNWGAFRIFKKVNGTYKIVKTYQREGNFTPYGATSISAVDYDKDGDMDLVFSMEGSVTGAPMVYDRKAIEIYRNEGNLGFTRVTSQIVPQSVWDDSEFSFEEIQIVDVNHDGYPDIFFQIGGQGSKSLPKSTTVDIGSMILKNDNGKGFSWMTGTKGMTVTFSSMSAMPRAFRYMDNNGDSLRIFGFNEHGVPTVIHIQAGK